MDLRAFNQQLKTTTDLIKDNEKFLTGRLVSKARQVADQYPYDTTVRDMYHYLDSKSQKQGMMTRSEIKWAYQQFYTPRSVFAFHFENELGVEKKPEVKKIASVETDLLKEYQDKTSDPFLKNALASLFDKKNPAKLYSDISAQNAVRSTTAQLNSLKVSPNSVQVLTGNEQFIICRAGFNTPKGEISVLIPVKSERNQLLFPTTFVTEAGLKDLTSDNLIKHLNYNAGKILKINAETLLDQLSKKSESLSDVEEAIAKLKLAKFKNAPLNNLGIVYKESFFETKAPVQDIKMDLPNELKPFTEQLGTKAGEAEFIFGKKTVSNARELISRKLANLGFNQAQIKVSDLNKSQITYAVSIANKGFTVPITIENNYIKEPMFVVANGSLMGFDRLGLEKVIASNPDHKAVLESSVYFDAKVGEVSKRLEHALSEQNFKAASELLQVLQAKDAASFREGLELYKKALMGGDIYKTASFGCSAPIRSQNSISPICSHTGLPINKVYQDKFGSCRPLYRKGAEASNKEHSEFLDKNTLIWT